MNSIQQTHDLGLPEMSALPQIIARMLSFSGFNFFWAGGPSNMCELFVHFNSYLNSVGAQCSFYWAKLEQILTQDLGG